MCAAFVVHVFLNGSIKSSSHVVSLLYVLFLYVYIVYLPALQKVFEMGSGCVIHNLGSGNGLSVKDMTLTQVGML